MTSWSAKFTRKSGLRCGDPMCHLATFENPDNLGSTGIAEPDATFAVLSTPIRSSPRDHRPLSAVRQRSVGGDVERHVGTSERLANNECGVVWRDHTAVGKCDVVGSDFRAAVGADQNQARSRVVGAGFQVEAEMTDVGIAGDVDNHVIALINRQV